MIYVMLFFLFFHFFYLELRRLPIRYLMIFMLCVSIIQGFFIGYTNILLIASMLSLNVGVVYLAWLLQGASYDKVKWNIMSYLSAG